LAAAPSFPLKFERRIVALPYQGATTDLPVDLFSVSGQYAIVAAVAAIIGIVVTLLALGSSRFARPY
jgi:esterase FrsA